MTSLKPSSPTILQVERAIGDLRRGEPVLLIGKDKPQLVWAGEYLPDEQYITDGVHPAVKLMKFAGLLPRAVIKESVENPDHVLQVSATAIEHYTMALAESLEKVSEARVPLKDAEHVRIIAFRPRFSHEEHLAVIVGDPKKTKAPYVRIHSSCVTGDVFASLRCDCGSQLHQAIDTMNREGAGVVLYMSQEGRGIGIANKLRAYGLQDKGMDTVEANVALGFEADERDFALAAKMLNYLEINEVTLLTNNPAKVAALKKHGIKIAKRESVTTEPNSHNQHYLDTKARKMKHEF